MLIDKKTLEKLRNLINEETEYRSGSNLVEFFKELGFNDSYGQGFPSRWIYTDERLNKINGTPELDKCIRLVFNPINFVSRIDILDSLIKDFNLYLAFNNWKVVRKSKEITFERTDNIEALNEKPIENQDEFLKKEFDQINIESLEIDPIISKIIYDRLEEIKSCLQGKANLAVIFLCGSTLEGILLGCASKYPRQFNQAKSTPKSKEDKPKQFHEWSLIHFIDVAYEIGILYEDVKKFSHSLRDFRNYIHPYEQLSRNFHPNEHTAKLCFQVLRAAIYELSINLKKLKEN
ncbi:MAG: hypothetical protein KC550_04870 [Nanoarchaeota archaeon]|nr:hypothetical protein [Nanoarchaeota archaeon]